MYLPRSLVLSVLFLMSAMINPVLSSHPPKNVPANATYLNKAELWVLDKDDVQYVWHKNGTPRSTGKIIHNLRTGAWQFFFSNGKLEASGNYENGKKTGIWKLYSDKGYLQQSGAFENNFKTGKWVEYYPDQKIKMEGEYSGGMKTGVWKNYYTNKQVFYEGTYKEGRQDGEWIYYFANGKMQQKGKLLNGVRVGKWEICIQPQGPCGTENYAHSRVPARSNLSEIDIKSGKTGNTKNPAELLDSLDSGGVPDHTPANLKNNQWD